MLEGILSVPMNLSPEFQMNEFAPPPHQARASPSISFFSAPQPAKQPPDFRSDSSQLFSVGGGNCPHEFFASTRELNEHLAAIRGAWHPHDKFLRYKPVNQPDGAVVAKLQSFRQFAHGEPFATGKALDGQQRLVLLGRDAGGLGGFLAETDEPPKRVTKRRQRFILRLADLAWSCHCSFDIYRNTI
jgi:hypothetical protein